MSIVGVGRQGYKYRKSRYTRKWIYQEQVDKVICIDGVGRQGYTYREAIGRQEYGYSWSRQTRI